jgi:hypothetical protein
MAEVGLVLFAKTALEVMQQVLPAYGRKFSKHTFTQSHLMTILCLMRFEDWTFRAAEVRLAEHSDLRRALSLVDATGLAPGSIRAVCINRRTDRDAAHADHAVGLGLQHLPPVAATSFESVSEDVNRASRV